MMMRALYTIAITVTLLAWTVAPALAESDPAHATDASTHAPADAHGGGHDAESPQLNPMVFQMDLAIWTAVVFLLLLVVLSVFAWKPIMDGLDKREKHVAGEITAAERSNEEARKLLAEYQQKLTESEEEVREMIDVAKKDAERSGQKIVEQARAAAEAEKKRALQDIDAAKSGVLKELAQQSATLAVELAGKIVQSKLDPKAHTLMINRAVTDFSKQNN